MCRIYFFRFFKLDKVYFVNYLISLIKTYKGDEIIFISVEMFAVVNYYPLRFQ